MEATQPGGQPDQAAVDAAVADLQSAVNDVKGRVQSDLDNLRSQLQAANEAHSSIDLTEIIQRVEQISVDVQTIDPAAAVSSGDAGAPADASDAPDGAVTGDQAGDPVDPQPAETPTGPPPAGDVPGEGAPASDPGAAGGDVAPGSDAGTDAPAGDGWGEDTGTAPDTGATPGG